MKNKKLGISLVMGVILLVLPFLLGVYPKIDSVLSYLLPVILIPIIIYLSGIFINKIKENNGKIFWGLLISFIALGLFLLKQYLFYLFFGMPSKKGILFIYSLFPNFLFPSLNDLLLKLNFIGVIPFHMIIDFIFVFIVYFVVGFLVGFIIGKIKFRGKRK